MDSMKNEFEKQDLSLLITLSAVSGLPRISTELTKLVRLQFHCSLEVETC